MTHFGNEANVSLIYDIWNFVVWKYLVIEVNNFCTHIRPIILIKNECRPSGPGALKGSKDCTAERDLLLDNGRRRASLIAEVRGRSRGSMV